MSRIPVATTITDVAAARRGAVTPERVHVVSGHYDSSGTDETDILWTGEPTPTWSGTRWCDGRPPSHAGPTWCQ